MCVFSDTCRNRGINEKVVAFIVIEGIRLVLKVAHRNIQSTIVVIVCKCNSHPRFRFSHITAANPRKQSNFFKGAIAPVLKEEIEILIIGDVDVSVTIVITISNGDTETVCCRHAQQAALFSYVCESAIRVIMIKQIRLRRIGTRTTIDRDVVAIARFICIAGIFRIIGHIEFKKPIVIEVSKDTTRPPSCICDLCRHCDIRKSAICVVPIEDIGSKVR